MSTTIRILAKENNEHGDLFGKLMSGLFLALGYDDAHLNIHKTGREIDIEAVHRTEKRRVIAECKATETSTGGDDINKFIGILDAEKRKIKGTIGYYISLSGFTEPALEQEKEAGGQRVVLLNGKQIIDELVKGNIIITREEAMQSAGRCAARESCNLIPETTNELLATGLGWIWVIYFMQNRQRTHFALIYADGEALAPTLSQTIIEADRSVGGSLSALTYLPPLAISIPEDRIIKAREHYFKYLSEECGEITLSGLPADQEIGSKRLNLEHLFIPLFLQPIEAKQANSEKSAAENERNRFIVGEVLSDVSHLAILAVPGGGKTTLLKRIAIAYAFPERRNAVDDKLPDRKWIPLFIRCRQLPASSLTSIFDIVSLIPNLAEMKEYSDEFSLLVRRAFRDGTALLLIDGLDEISNESERVKFITQLRTFMSVYPTVGVIITSREAGFRVIGSALNTYCKHYRITDFDNSDIKRLTLAWHKEVVGNQEKVRFEAEKLADTICRTERVRTLAKNPLLLTTLLLVKRWVGELPSRRSVLYGKAIEVLLMTWNVEGYERIELDEAIPQLAFVAFTMMRDGVQRISSKKLKELLLIARKQMPDVLGYARLGVSEFIERVELRSSLLIFSGHAIEDGTLYPMYEFRHLTFQEYLTARAIVDGYYPDRRDNDTILSVLQQHIKKPNWKEVVPLTATLAGRKAQPLIEYMIELCKTEDPRNTSKIVTQLEQCFVDEVQISPKVLETGLEWIARRHKGTYDSQYADIYTGKYGDVFLNVIKKAFMNSLTDVVNLGGSLGEITLAQIERENKSPPEKLDKILSLLESGDTLTMASGALAAMEFTYRFNNALQKNPYKKIDRLGKRLVELIHSTDTQLQLAAMWALAWLGERQLWNPNKDPQVIVRLVHNAQNAIDSDIQYMAFWAIAELPIISTNPISQYDDQLIKLVKEWALKKGSTSKTSSVDEKTRFFAQRKAAILLAFYLRQPWNEQELYVLIEKTLSTKPHRSWLNGEYIMREIEKRHGGKMKLSVKQMRITRKSQIEEERIRNIIEKD